jgi:hypothetical protein
VFLFSAASKCNQLTIIIIIIMSMRREYISKLRPPTDLLFIPQEIYGHEQAWWNNIERVKLLNRAPELSGNPTISHLVAKQEKLAKEMNLALRNIFIHTTEGYLTRCKILQNGVTALFSARSKACCEIFIALKYPSASAGSEPTYLGANSKHASHYTTEDDLTQEIVQWRSSVNMIMSLRDLH